MLWIIWRIRKSEILTDEFWKMVVMCTIMISCYMTEGGKLYHVESVTENTKVFEIACTRVGER